MSTSPFAVVSCRLCGMGRLYTRMTLPHNCSIVVVFFPLSPNRTNPEMNPNPVSRWSDPWRGSKKCLMVNKQHTNDSGCVLVHVCSLNLWVSWSVCFSVLYEYHEVSSGNDCQTTTVQTFQCSCVIFDSPNLPFYSFIFLLTGSSLQSFISFVI